MSARGTYETVPSSATCRTRSAGLSTRCEGVVEGGEMTDKTIPVNSAVCYVGHRTNGEELSGAQRAALHSAVLVGTVCVIGQRRHFGRGLKFGGGEAVEQAAAAAIHQAACNTCGAPASWAPPPLGARNSCHAEGTGETRLGMMTNKVHKQGLQNRLESPRARRNFDPSCRWIYPPTFVVMWGEGGRGTSCPRSWPG